MLSLLLLQLQLQLQPIMHPKPKGKIYLLIGYLGSGKTTFIRNLLANKTGQKYAVIQNQFAQGTMGIEQPLIMDQSGIPFSSFLELPNGCICCSAKNDLVAGVEYILANTDVQNIIVQTNGLADPAQAIKQFWFDQTLQLHAELHSIITLISVKRYPKLKQQQLFHKQVVYANRVLLTFVDQVEEEDVNGVWEAVRDGNRDCVIARNDQYDVRQFLAGASMFNLQTLHTLHSTTSHNPNKPHHSGIQSLSFSGPTCHQTKSQFEHAVGHILWQLPAGARVMRIKGLISLEDNPCVYELQGVDEVFEIKSSQMGKGKVGGRTVVLVIGEGLDRKRIGDILKIKQDSASTK